jgi:hypothetical protein
MTLISIPIDREILQGPQYDLLEILDIRMKIFSPLPQVKYGVDSELARPMIGDIPTSIDKEKGYSLLGKLLS